MGGNGANFSNTILDDQATKSIQNVTTAEAPFTGSFSPKDKLANFDNMYAGGNWNLRIADNKFNGIGGQFNNWGVQLNTYNPHGTSVAGIAAASGNNRMGVTGVSPDAGLAGLRLIADEVTDKQIADALSYKNKNIDIYNNSWKQEEELSLLPQSLEIIKKGVTEGRQNKLGNIYVFAGGNNRWDGGNVNYNGFANSRYVIPVAAIDHNGEYTWYSEEGAPLLVSAYSSSVNKSDNQPAGVTTTDMLGNQGFDPSDYTSRFSGTSSAAPLVSGVVALMLEANPNLSWRDVQHILVNTAKKNDPNNEDWKQNGAGRWVNHNYGFGAIDAAAAVSAATNWTPVDKEVRISSSIVKNVLDTILDDNNQGLVSKINIDSDITVEKVEVQFNTKPLTSGSAKWQYWGDLRVVLTSPDGTESILAEPHELANDPDSYNIDEKTNVFTWNFTSARHWGESSKGEWKLQVYDLEGNEIQGYWNSWKLNIYGTKPTVTVIADDANASESGDKGQFRIIRTGNIKNPLTVNYTTTGSAINGTDYNKITGSFTITSGANSALIPITVIDDAVYEGNENVIVNLAANDAYSLGSEKSATVAIGDNDIPTEPWIRQIGTATDWDMSRGTAIDSNGNVYMAGITFGSLDGNVNASGINTSWADPFITKYDATGNKLWTRQLGSSGYDYYNGVAADSTGNVYTVGYDDGLGTVFGGVTLIKWDTSGNKVWSKFFDTKAHDWASGVTTDSGGNLYIAGMTDYSLIGDLNRDAEAFVVKYDSSGNQLWSREWGTTGQDMARSVVTDTNGNIYVAGVTEGSLDGNISAGGTDVFLTKYDPNGTKLWTRQLGTAASDGYVYKNGIGGEYGRNVIVAVDGGGNAYISGTTEGSLDGNTSAGDRDAFITKYDANGNKLWTHQLGTTGDDRAWGVTIDNAGKVYMAGNTSGSLDDKINSGSVDAFVTQYDSNGNKLWTRLLGTATEDRLQDVAVDQVGNIYMTGYTFGSLGDTNAGYADAWVSKNSFTNATPPNHWNAKFINRTSANIADRTTYDFSNPAAVLDLGDQHQGASNEVIRLYQNWGDGSPNSSVQTDNFAMEAWTRTNFEAGKVYKITTRSDDGTWFNLKNVQTGQWVGDSVVLGGDGADWRDRSTAMPPRTIFFKVPESGEYDFYVQYYEKGGGSIIDINLEEAKPFQDSVNESQRWESTVYWWDRKLGNVPLGDFYKNQSNMIGVVDQGSNIRSSDGKKGINFSYPDYQSLNNDERLPDNNYAIDSYTQTNLEAGVRYRAKVTADDGFQLLTKLANTNEWVYITPKDQWQQAYGGTKVDFEVNKDGLYDMHFYYYEERGTAGLDLSWEVVPFTATVIATAGANVRSSPNRNQAPVGFLDYLTPVTFDKWTTGELIDYTAELGPEHISDKWYRIAGTNNWISAAILSEKEYLDI